MLRLLAIALVFSSLGCTTIPSAEREQQLHDLEAEFRALFMTIYGPESPLVKAIATTFKRHRQPKRQVQILGYGAYVSTGTIGAPNLIAELASQFSAAAKHTLITEDLKVIISEVQRKRFEGRHDTYSQQVAQLAIDLFHAHGKKKKQRQIEGEFFHDTEGPERTLARFAAGPVAKNEVRRRLRFFKECRKNLEAFRKKNLRQTGTELLQRLKAAGALSEEI